MELADGRGRDFTFALKASAPAEVEEGPTTERKLLDGDQNQSERAGPITSQREETREQQETNSPPPIIKAQTK